MVRFLNLRFVTLVTLHCCFVGAIRSAEPVPVPQPQLDIQLQATITLRIGNSTRRYTCRLPCEQGFTTTIRKLPSKQFGELPQIMLRRQKGFVVGSE